MKQIVIIATVGILLLPITEIVAARKVTIPTATKENIEKGKQLAFENSKGNCLACHMMDNGEMPGNLGPPLIQMKQRFPKRSVLRAQIWDATAINPQSVMPPFGKHGILTDEEVDRVVDYMYSL